MDAQVVADRLAESRTAHLAYRHAVATNDRTTAHAALVTAQTARLAAQTDDPTFTAPAWAEQEATYPHVALLLFYASELAK
jgi:hypothetical protein